MKRRDFMSTVGAGAAAAATAGTTLAGLGTTSALAASGTERKLKMHVGTQRAITRRRRRRGGPDLSPEEQAEMQTQTLQYFSRFGVEHACAYHPHHRREREHHSLWTVEDLEKTRDIYAEHGISLDMVALPLLDSSHVDREARPNIMLGKSPERDRDIEAINTMTANCAKAGIPAWKYNLSLLGVLRTGRTPGRGGVRYSTWKLSEAEPETPLTQAGVVTEEIAWERITYLLERVIPVCEEYKVQAACHPHDPGVPPEGFQGIVRVLGSLDGLKKLVSINESPYHGLNLCLGTMSENLDNPAEEIHDVIRYFGTRKKIFNIHFRNIKGGRDEFQEVFVDNGDVDMLQAMLTLAEVDYPYMIMPDHVPRHEDDSGGLQSFAFTYGYIKACIAAAEKMVG